MLIKKNCLVFLKQFLIEGLCFVGYSIVLNFIEKTQRKRTHYFFVFPLIQKTAMQFSEWNTLLLTCSSGRNIIEPTVQTLIIKMFAFGRQATVVLYRRLTTQTNRSDIGLMGSLLSKIQSQKTEQREAQCRQKHPNVSKTDRFRGQLCCRHVLNIRPPARPS